MKNSIFLSTTFCAAFAAQMGLQAQEKPNIIYILADDLGRSEIDCYGQQLIETPNIDQLAADGMTFTDHYCGQAVSGPSRCVLFTGLHSGHAYIRGNDEMSSRGNVWSHAAMLADSTLEGQHPVPGNTIMIPRMMKEAGYTTGCVGKWGLGYPGSASTPIKMGFDFFYGYNCQRQSHTYFPPFLYRNEHREYTRNHLVPLTEKLPKGSDPKDEASYSRFHQIDYAPDLMFSELTKFVDRNKKKPFVLFWTTTVPHVSLQYGGRKWVDYYHEKFGDEKPYLGDKGYFPCRYPKATYAAMVSHWDEQIGELIQQLKKHGIYKNTVIIFTSDNGPTFNGGTDSDFFDSAKPFRSDYHWGKGSLREGGIRTPMLATWPNHIEAGSRTELISGFQDMMPTFCEIAEINCPPTDGISLLPTLLGEKQKNQHEYLYWEFPEYGGQKAVRMGKWKAYVDRIVKGNRHIELYDISVDPREHTDLSRYHPDIIATVKEIFKNEHTDAEIKKFNLPW